MMPAHLGTLFILMAALVLANVVMRLYWASGRLRTDPRS